MAKPTQASLSELKRVARYLKRYPGCVMKYPVQTCEDARALHVYTDSDWAGDPVQRKSTTGMVMCRGVHCLRHSSTTQTVIGLSSAESEFYALCRGASSALGVRSFYRDLGIEVEIAVHSDASAARAAASRRGLGKVRHLQTRFLWLQDAVASKSVSLRVIPGSENPADSLTKALPRALLHKHCYKVGSVPTLTCNP